MFPNSYELSPLGELALASSATGASEEFGKTRATEIGSRRRPKKTPDFENGLAQARVGRVFPNSYELSPLGELALASSATGASEEFGKTGATEIGSRRRPKKTPNFENGLAQARVGRVFPNSYELSPLGELALASSATGASEEFGKTGATEIGSRRRPKKTPNFENGLAQAVFTQVLTCLAGVLFLPNPFDDKQFRIDRCLTAVDFLRHSSINCRSHEAASAIPGTVLPKLFGF